ncbi:NAD(P)H-dependent FMN reductase [Actinoalloteichus hoggarensis]|uniref:FMN-dependent NADPH-azoreductase n=1 Tax=Actinoalloteichus hoggarensis TaxID=1470176 RepID=A0A221W3L0_9PSEU|nr:NAD(P)H-dependent oxidoreductase [Actinoalloteichus hoggarensis]ASO20450.1 FMN-dependent NADPH-azoreductase [Actinoalloteichus hoggarensis]MBB5923490.1 NAD(P)H-dependent FMN reductase [Actinoalloteichus hoggarensis]
MSEPLRLAVIIGSVRAGRFGPTITRWVTGQALRRRATTVDVVDLADTAAAPRFAERIDAADAVVLVTPEYNHGYPGPVKVAVDSLREEWHTKPVAFVSYGGISGGLRAVEQLRQVFAELHAVTVRETVSFHNAGERFDADGELRDPDTARHAAHRMFDQLDWWATALRRGRAARPYPG